NNPFCNSIRRTKLTCNLESVLLRLEFDITPFWLILRNYTRDSYRPTDRSIVKSFRLDIYPINVVSFSLPVLAGSFRSNYTRPGKLLHLREILKPLHRHPKPRDTHFDPTNPLITYIAASIPSLNTYLYISLTVHCWCVN